MAEKQAKPSFHSNFCPYLCLERTGRYSQFATTQGFVSHLGKELRIIDKEHFVITPGTLEKITIPAIGDSHASGRI